MTTWIERRPHSEESPHANVAAATSPPMNTLFDRLGGSTAIEAVVGEFYRRVLDDELPQPMLQGIDIERLNQHQQRFMNFAFGGRRRYEGRSLQAAHADLVARRGLGDAHFDAVARHLGDALRTLGVGAALVDETLGVVGSVRADVLGSSSSG